MAVSAALAALAMAAIVTFWLTGGSDGDDTVAAPGGDTQGETATSGPEGEEMSQGTGVVALLSKPMGGQQAIDALGDDIAIVAERNNMTVDEVRALLLRDRTAKVGLTGHIFYEETLRAPAPSS